jgi:stage V sporulation protein S
MQSLRVSASSRPKAVAGAIAAVIKESGPLEIQAVGAAAVNQAIKAVAIARGYLAPDGYDVVLRPEFMELAIDGESRTGVRLVVEPR